MRRPDARFRTRLFGVLVVALAAVVVVVSAILWYPPVLGAGAEVFNSETHFLLRAVTPGQVDVNTAPAEELAVLPGIGEVRAQAIVAWREANGRFSGPEDLKQVHGIGPKTMDNIAVMVKYS